MVSNGDITASQAQAATDRMRSPEGTVLAGGWFADWAAERAKSDDPGDQDASILTTLDPRIQQAAERSVGATMLAGPGAGASRISSCGGRAGFRHRRGACDGWRPQLSGKRL